MCRRASLKPRRRLLNYATGINHRGKISWRLGLNPQCTKCTNLGSAQEICTNGELYNLRGTDAAGNFHRWIIRRNYLNSSPDTEISMTGILPGSHLPVRIRGSILLIVDQERYKELMGGPLEKETWLDSSHHLQKLR